MSTSPKLAVRFEQHFPKHVVPANSVIFREGETADCAYLVRSGEVDIATTNQNGQMVLLTTLHEGQIFGELALFNEEIRSANAITKPGCELLVIHRDRLVSLLDKADPFLKFLLDYLAERIIDLSKRAR